MRASLQPKALGSFRPAARLPFLASQGSLLEVNPESNPFREDPGTMAAVWESLENTVRVASLSTII